MCDFKSFTLLVETLKSDKKITATRIIIKDLETSGCFLTVTHVKSSGLLTFQILALVMDKMINLTFICLV